MFYYHKDSRETRCNRTNNASDWDAFYELKMHWYYEFDSYILYWYVNSGVGCGETLRVKKTSVLKYMYSILGFGFHIMAHGMKGFSNGNVISFADVAYLRATHTSLDVSTINTQLRQRFI